MTPEFTPSPFNSKAATRFSGKRLLIAGGTGVVGLGLIRYLGFLSREYSVDFGITVIGTRPEPSTFLSLQNAEVTYLEGDLTNASWLRGLSDFDFVIHAGGYAQPGIFMANPHKTLAINSVSVMALRELASEAFLFVSSSEVYSGLDVKNLSETQMGTTTPFHPRAAYIEGKKFGEVASISSDPHYRVLGSAARLALAYGPGTYLDDKRVLSELVLRGLTLGKVELMDSGQRLRTYCHVNDAAEMLIAVLLETEGEIVNVGGVSSVSIRELGFQIAQLLDVPFIAPAHHHDAADSSPAVVNLDLSRVLSLLEKREFVPLGQGLNQIIEWYKYLLSHE